MPVDDASPEDPALFDKKAAIDSQKLTISDGVIICMRLKVVSCKKKKLAMLLHAYLLPSSLCTDVSRTVL